MVRANEFLEFSYDQNTGNGAPRVPGYRRRPGGNNADLSGILFLLIVFLVAIIGCTAALLEKGATPVIAAQTHAPAPTSSRGGAIEAVPVQETGPVQQAPSMPPYVFSLQVDDRIYRIDARGGAIDGDLPPGFHLGWTSAQLQLFDSPRGILVGMIPEREWFVYRAVPSQDSCWYWMVTVDGQSAGYIHISGAPATSLWHPAAQEAADYIVQSLLHSTSGLPVPRFDHPMTEPDTTPSDSDEDEAFESLPIAPYGCVSVPGYVETLQIGKEPPRKYRFRMCGSGEWTPNEP
jgi:hypothetical protein